MLELIWSKVWIYDELGGLYEILKSGLVVSCLVGVMLKLGLVLVWLFWNLYY